MRILVVHNFYQQPGGEDQVFATECALLAAHGHEVFPYTVHNDRVDGMSRVALLRSTLWNSAIGDELRAIVRRRRIDVAHFHNTFPLISPAAYGAVRAAGAAVVQTIHNFRLRCLNAVLFRDGRVCEDCSGKSLPLAGVTHSCYRGNRVASAVSALTVALHRALGTWRRNVDAYICPSELARRKIGECDLPARKLFVKPNGVYPDPGVGDGGGGYAVFVGRLSFEKGLQTLLDGWSRVGRSMQLKIVGDGPLAPMVQAAAKEGRIEWLGRLPAQRVLDIIGRAALLVFPSECYETFGRVAVEAFAKGTPVIASNMGAGAEIVEHGRTGFLFRSGDGEDLARQVRAAVSDPAQLLQMRRDARQAYEIHYTGERDCQELVRIYHLAIAERAVRC